MYNRKEELRDFINEVKAQTGKHILTEAAGYLLRDAAVIAASRHIQEE
ncbi:hypothetical protein [Paenibacillus hamazuiensis]|nr:hypothetical protein [Paenibacillus hamazuiensis]